MSSLVSLGSFFYFQLRDIKVFKVSKDFYEASPVLKGGGGGLL